LRTQIPDDYFDNPDAYIGCSLEDLDPATAYMHTALEGANWLTDHTDKHLPSDSQPRAHLYNSMLRDPIGNYSDCLNFWEYQIKIMSNKAAATHRSQVDPSRQTATVQTPETIQGFHPYAPCAINVSGSSPETYHYSKSTTDDSRTFNDHVEHIASTQGLNAAQQMAFEICASKFHELLESTPSNMSNYCPL
jgi:hypothetical protein